MLPQPQNRRQYLQFALVLLGLTCLVPTRLFFKSKKWQFLPPIFKKNRGQPFVAINNNNTAECRFLPEALLQFTNALHNRPESTALKPWTLANVGPKYPTWYFPGMSASLLEDAFRGRRTMLIGDSTLFNWMRWMQTLGNNLTTHQVDALGHMQLTRAFFAVNPDALEQVGWADETPAQWHNEQDGTLIVWDGHRGDPGEEACQFEGIWNRIRQVQPDILVVNFGLHWLHLMGGGRDVPLCSIQKWLDYEDWLEQVVQVTQQSKVKLLLFKTTNFICMDNYWGDYSDSARLYERQDAYIMDKCQREIQRLMDAHPHTVQLTQDDMKRYCTKGVLDEFGSQDLNHRLLEFVTQRQATTTDLTMEIFNDHGVQSCAYSEPNDGRHYHPLNLMRIRLLANMIQCLYPKEEET